MIYSSQPVFCNGNSFESMPPLQSRWVPHWPSVKGTRHGDGAHLAKWKEPFLMQTFAKHEDVKMVLKYHFSGLWPTVYSCAQGNGILSTFNTFMNSWNVDQNLSMFHFLTVSHPVLSFYSMALHLCISFSSACHAQSSHLKSSHCPQVC